ncbi:MAG: hypothetical protein IJ420_09500, partial [Lachnospiraceae bacterium]|nr:hypothetical protein [Lachnospiraceae bacterium]
MVKQNKWVFLFAMFFFGLAMEIFTPDNVTRTAEATVRDREARQIAECMDAMEENSESLTLLSTEEFWKNT